VAREACHRQRDKEISEWEVKRQERKKLNKEKEKDYLYQKISGI
jgi:hypothetical protein